MDSITLKFELQVPGQRLISMFQTNNKDIDDQIEQGIKKAVEELATGNVIADSITEQVKRDILRSVTSITQDWELNKKVSKLYNEKLEEMLRAHADSLSIILQDKLGMKSQPLAKCIAENININKTNWTDRDEVFLQKEIERIITLWQVS